MKSVVVVILLTLLSGSNNCIGQSDNISDTSTSSITLPPGSLQNPTGYYGGHFGGASVGVAFPNRTRKINHPDINKGLFIGLGDPEKFVGIGLGLNIYGLSNSSGAKDNFGEGGLDLNINKYLFNKIAVSVGAKNVTTWASEEEPIHLQRSYYC